MTPDERAIRDVVETWMTATRDGDLTTVLSLMTDDVVFMVPGKAPFGKEAYLRNYIDLTVRPADGPPARRVGYTLTIFRRQPDGRWLLSRDANLLTAREG
jgi:ketosteroid isomerase-like protein